MSKKFFFVGTLALLGASWFLLGCPTEAETSTVYDRTGSVYGKVEIAVLQKAIDDAVAEDRALTLENLELSDAGVVDLKTAKVTIAGALTLKSGGGTIINAGDATVSFAEDATIAGAATDIIVGSPEVFTTETVPSAKIAAPVTALPKEVPVGGITAIKDYALTDTADDVISGLTVYVYGNLDVTADSVAPTGNVVAIGTVTLKGNNAVALASSTVDVSGADIVAETAATTVTLPAAAAAKSLTVSGAGLTIAGAGTSLALGSLTGSVTLPAAIPAVTIEGGTGSVTITPAAELTLTTASFGNTGTTTINNDSYAVTFSNAANFAGAVSFSGAVTLSGAASFGGDVTVTDAKAVTLSANAVRLKAGASIKIADDTSPITVLTAAQDTVLTPKVNATLTPAKSSKTLALTKADLELTSGGLTVAEDATLSLGTQTLTVKGSADKETTLAVLGTLFVGGETNAVTLTGAAIIGSDSTGTTLVGTNSSEAVALAAGDVLALLDEGSLAILGGAKVTAGQTTLSGAGTWTASISGTAEADGKYAVVAIVSSANGATIVFDDGDVAGATGGTLTASGTAPAITQAAAASNALTIGANTTVALMGDDSTAVGKITLSANDTNPGNLILLGTITTGNTSADVPAAPLSDDGSTEVASETTYTKIGVENLVGDGTNATLEPTNAPTSSNKSAAGKIVKLIGAEGATIKGGSGTAGTISSTVATVADETE